MAESEGSEKPTPDETLKLLEIVGSWKDTEADRFWTRFNFVFLINSALLATTLIAYSSDKNLLPLELCGKHLSIIALLALLGAVVSVVWFFLLLSAKRYEDRLIDDIDRILADVDRFKAKVKGYSDRSAGTKSIKATIYARIIPWMFVIFWLVLFIASL